MSDNNQPTLSTTNVDVTLVDDTHVPTETETHSTDVLPAESTSATPPPDEEETESYDSADDDSDNDSEYETVDLAQSEIYQVLNLFLSRSPTEEQDEYEQTENVADVLHSLRESVDKLTAVLQNAVSTLASASSASQHKSSSSVRRHRTKKSSSS